MRVPVKVGPLWSTVAFAALLASCAPSKPAPVEKVRIGVASIPVYALLFVAEDAGLFAEEGVEVEVVRFTAGRDAIAPMMRGELDAATIYTTPILLEAMEGNPLVGFTTLHRARGLSGLVTRPAANVRSFAELRGKRIGVTPNTSSEFLLTLMTAEGGLHAGDVEVVSGDPQRLLDGLAAGSLDGAVLWGQQFLSARGPSGDEYRRLTSDAYSEISFLTTTRETYERRGAAFLRVLRALARAERRVGDEPGIARGAIEKRFPYLSAPQVDEVMSRARFEIGLTNLALFMLRQEGAFLQQTTGRDAPVVTQLLRPELVHEIAPETVTALLEPPEGRGVAVPPPAEEPR